MAQVLTFPIASPSRGLSWQERLDKTIAAHDAAMAPARTMTDTFVKVAILRVPRGTPIGDIRYEGARARAGKQFVEAYEKRGWQLVSRVLIRKVPVIPDDAPIKARGINESNPLRAPDEDIYEIVARFRRRPIAGKLILPDYMAGALLPGMRMRD